MEGPIELGTSSTADKRLWTTRDTPLDGLRSRFERASPNNVKHAELMNHLQLIARVSNGIYLQNALMKSVVPEDEVIAEILHMSPMTPERLISVKESTIEEVVAMMKKASAQFVKNTDSIRMENRYLNMHLAMSTDMNWADFQTFQSKQDYEKHLDTLIATPVDGSDIGDYLSSLETLERELGKIDEMKADEDSDTDIIETDKSALLIIYVSLIHVEDDMKEFKTILSFVNKVKELKEKTSFVDLLIGENNLRGYQEIRVIDTSAEEQSTANINLFEEIGSKFAEYADEITKLTGLAESLQSVRQTDVKYTMGYPRGVKDLEKLPADTEDKEFLDITHISKETSRTLRKAILPLEEVQWALKKVEQTWKPALGKISTFLVALSQYLIMTNQSNRTTDRTNDMKAMNHCYETFSKSVKTDFTSIRSAIESIQNLTAQVDPLSTFDPAPLFIHFEVLSNVTEIDNSLPDEEKNKITPGRVKKIKSMSEVGETLKNLKVLQEQAKPMKRVVDGIAGNLTLIKQGLKSITPHHDQTVNTNIADWYKCLKESVKDDGALVAEMLNAIQTIRRLADQGTEDTEVFLKTIMDSIDELKTAKEVANGLRNETSFEAKSLDALKKSAEVAERIGTAVQGVSEILKASENRQKLEPLMGDISFISKAVDVVKRRLKPEVVARLGELQSLPTSLKGMFEDIDEFLTTVETLDLKTNLTMSSRVFAAGAKVRAVKVDVKGVKKALEVLEAKNPPVGKQMVNVTASLDTLEQLDLEFSGYRMTEATSSLELLDEFFREWPSVLAGDSGANGNKESAEEDTGIMSLILIAIGSFVAVALIIGAIVLFVHRKRAVKKKKPDMSNKSDATTQDSQLNK